MLVAIGLAGGEGRSQQRSTTRTIHASSEPATPVAVVARRVQRIRDLRFRRLPPARRVSPAQAEHAGLADFDRSYPAAARHADEALLERLGALPRGADLRHEIGSAFRDQVGGYYDPRTKRLAVVGGPASQGAAGDIVLAHELNHALEDQRYGLDEPGSQAAIDDRSLANSALVEGTATSVMLDYARRFLDPGQALSDLLPAALQSSRSAKLPRYLQDSLMFPYDGGLAFVNALYARLHGWALVDYALRRRRPASTEQVLHPQRYLADERPLPVPAPPAPGRGWRPVRHGTFGEFDTAELLRLAGAQDAADAAGGWGGGRYALWRHGRAIALALVWRWDTRRDARQAAAALATYRRFAARRGPVALATHGAVTALGFAPTPALARRVAGAS